MHSLSCPFVLNVCVVCLGRWTMLQDVLKSWQEYREEERRLSKWLAEKEAQIEEMKHIDLGDIEVVRKGLKMVIVSGFLPTTFQTVLLPRCLRGR